MSLPNIVVRKLANGFTYLFCKKKNQQKISLQMFYNVGSSSEKEGERGIAHLIEHMIFKGTDNLAEGDLDKIVYSLGGTCNAFTSYDYTGYTFDVPIQNYKPILKIISECMNKCTFDQNLLNSELKAVIQELKMYRDDALSFLTEEMISILFSHHKYAHPIIGYKEDIWSKKTESLKSFYQKWYSPNNSILVIVGNLEEDLILEEIRYLFESIPTVPTENLIQNKISYFPDQKEITIYRDVQQSHGIVAFRFPGFTIINHIFLDIFIELFGGGKGSFLYKELVYNLNLVTDIYSYAYDLFDSVVIFIYYQPKQNNTIERINLIIEEVMRKIMDPLFLTEEIYYSALKKIALKYEELYEDNHKIAYLLGKIYLAKKDNFKKDYETEMNHDLFLSLSKKYISYYGRLSLACVGKLFSLNQKDQFYLREDLSSNDKEDFETLNKIIRNDSGPIFSSKISLWEKDILLEKINNISLPVYEEKKLDNELTIIACDDRKAEKVEIIIDFKGKHWHEDFLTLGSLNILYEMLTEGTLLLKGGKFQAELDRLAIEIDVAPGQISATCLPEVFEEAITLIYQMMNEAELSPESFNRAKEQAISELYESMDSSESVGLKILKTELYKDHPYSKFLLGNKENILNITLHSIHEIYKKYIIPNDTLIVIIGSVTIQKAIYTVASLMSKWEKRISFLDATSNIDFPLKKEKKTIKHFMDRDQIVILLGNISVARTDKDYDKLLLLDQIFGGGALGSMQSLLFAIREQTGLFYSIQGTMIYGCGRHPGIIMIKAITSPKFVDDALTKIKIAWENLVNSITDEKINVAREAIISSLSDMVSFQTSIASTLIFLNRYNLDKNYFNSRIELLYGINKKDVIDAASRLASDFVEIIVGNI